MEAYSRAIKIFNGKIITPNKIIDGGCILIADDTITSVNEKNIETGGATEINAEGKFISPGFIDIHVHGGGGQDFMDADEEAFLKIAETHAQYGTTSMLPTTLTATKDEL